MSAIDECRVAAYAVTGGAGHMGFDNRHDVFPDHLRNISWRFDGTSSLSDDFWSPTSWPPMIDHT